MASKKKRATGGKKKLTSSDAGKAEPMHVSERLKRHVELMGECAVWAARAQDEFAKGNVAKAKRYLVLAERFLKKAKALEPGSQS